MEDGQITLTMQYITKGEASCRGQNRIKRTCTNRCYDGQRLVSMVLLHKRKPFRLKKNGERITGKRTSVIALTVTIPEARSRAECDVDPKAPQIYSTGVKGISICARSSMKST
jgi:hypothetical protein